MSNTMKTVRDFTRYAMTQMERHDVNLGHGSVDLWQEATFLVMRYLKLPFDRLESFWDANLTEEEAQELFNLIEKRTIEKIPAPYLLREAWLSEHPFYVDERVLIPRSFISELLAEGLSPWVEDVEEVESVLDLCTGSACLAILAAETFPNAAVTGSDISAEALEVARINREDYGLSEVLELVQSDLFENLQGRRFDVILSNPPYVTEGAMQTLPEEYRAEPELALVAGIDGMSVVSRMMRNLSAHLTEQGIAVIEIGDGREAFERLFPTLPVTWLTTSGGDDLVFMVSAKDLRENVF